MALKENPRLRGCVKLKGYENEYRKDVYRD